MPGVLRSNENARTEVDGGESLLGLVLRPRLLTALCDAAACSEAPPAGRHFRNRNGVPAGFGAPTCRRAAACGKRH